MTRRDRTRNPVLKRSSALLAFLLGASLLGNVFQVLWASSEDRVLIVSKAEIEVLIERARSTHAGSAAWHRILVNTPDKVVLEVADLVNFRGLFGNHVRRWIYMWSANGG